MSSRIYNFISSNPLDPEASVASDNGMEKHQSQEWDSLGSPGVKGLTFLSPQTAPGTKPQLVSSRHRGSIICLWENGPPTTGWPHLTPGFFKQFSPHKWQAEVNCTVLIEDCQKYQQAGGGRTWGFCTSELLAIVWCTWCAVGPELS